MVDSLTPLPPINARVARTQVTEKNPHHQNDQQKHHEKKEDDIEDEIVIDTHEKDKNSPEVTKKIFPSSPFHNIDIEA